MARVGRSSRRRAVRAFAPGHLTAAFVPDLEARDPRGRGSVGVGLVLDVGVRATARYDATGPRRTRLRSSPRNSLRISREVARRLRGDAPGTLTIDLDHDLPIGQGLGMSAAGAVATALAVGELFEVDPARRWATAHLADLTLRGGLGGVAAIDGGGIDHRSRAGIPPWGAVSHTRARGRVLLVPLGPPMPSPEILGDARRLAKLRRVGRALLDELDFPLTLPRLLDLANRFTDGIGLATPKVSRRLGALRADGGPFALAMFGNLAYTAGTGRLPAVPGSRAVRVGIGQRGAHLVDAE